MEVSNQHFGVKVTNEMWAVPAEGTTLDDLIARMRELGNEVLEVNRVENMLLVGRWEEGI